MFKNPTNKINAELNQFRQSFGALHETAQELENKIRKDVEATNAVIAQLVAENAKREADIKSLVEARQILNHVNTAQ